MIDKENEDQKINDYERGYRDGREEMYRRYRDWHVSIASAYRENTRRMKEQRKFRPTNFSIAELEEAIEIKRNGRPKPERTDWGALVMASLCLAEDAIKVLARIRYYVPKEELERYDIGYRHQNMFSRYTKLEKRFKETRAKSLGKITR